MLLRSAVAAAAVGACIVAPGAAPGGPSLERLVGQCVITGVSGSHASASLLDRVRNGQVGGVILYASNVSDVKALVAKLQQTAAAGGNPPLLVAVDQEGGSVRRLPGPPDRSEPELGRLADVARVRAEGQATGAYLHSLGVDVDFAPVLDTPSSARSFIGGRAYSRDAALNARLGASFVTGVQASHVAATAKHFPGLGTAVVNTDEAHVYLTAPKRALDARLAPFRAAVRAGVKLVMISNAGYRAYDPSGLPAVLSPRIVGGLLRHDLGYGGVVVSDAFEAPGPSGRANAGTLALEAGVDELLYTSESTGAAGYDALLASARNGMLPRATLEAANVRIAALKRWLAQA